MNLTRLLAQMMTASIFIIVIKKMSTIMNDVVKSAPSGSRRKLGKEREEGRSLCEILGMRIGKIEKITKEDAPVRREKEEPVKTPTREPVPVKVPARRSTIGYRIWRVVMLP